MRLSIALISMWGAFCLVSGPLPAAISQSDAGGTGTVTVSGGSADDQNRAVDWATVPPIAGGTGTLTVSGSGSLNGQNRLVDWSGVSPRANGVSKVTVSGGPVRRVAVPSRAVGQSAVAVGQVAAEDSSSEGPDFVGVFRMIAILIGAVLLIAAIVVVISMRK